MKTKRRSSKTKKRTSEEASESEVLYPEIEPRSRPKVKSKGYPPEVREGAYRLYKRGNTDIQVGKLIGVPEKTVGQWRKDKDWANRKRIDDLLVEEIRGPNIELEIASYTVMQLVQRFSRFVNKLLERVEEEFDEATLRQLLMLFDGRLDNVMKSLEGLQANLIKAQSAGQPTKIEHSGEVTLARLLEEAEKVDADGD